MRKYKLLFIVVLSFFLAQSTLYAQKTVSGVVTDAKDGSTLVGVTVLVKNTTTGTTTDLNGHYTLTVPDDAILVFSFVGYAPQEILVGTQTTINVQLEFSAAMIDEVVVIGYGQVRKEDLTGSVQVVTTDDFNQGAITTPQELLVGKSAGMVISSDGGAPGSSSTIRIRGGSSLNASNDPLIIIDGVPLDNNNVSGSSNFLSFLNPNDVESVSILKDASATAIYGSRASNGVIIIKTKQGVKGAPMKISFDVKTSIASAVKFLDVYSGDEIRRIAWEKRDLFGLDNLGLLWDANTNWQKELFHTSFSQDYNFTVAGAWKAVPYRVSIGYTNQEGIMKNTSMERFTGAINLNPSFLKDQLKVNFSIKGMLTDHNFGDSGALGSAINMDPTKPIYDDSFTTSNGYFQWQNYEANLGTPNPVEQLMDVDNTSTVKRVIGSIQFNYAIPYVDGLEANLNMASDYSEGSGVNNRPTSSPSTLTGTFWGKINDYSSIHRSNIIDFYLNYKKDFITLNSVFDITGGYSWQHNERERNSVTTGYFDEEHEEQDPIIDSYITENYLVSFFGRLNYTYANKYLFTFTARYDGSSRFIGDNKWGFFPSAAFAWKIKEEPFLKDVGFLSQLKLRLGWGITGQQDIIDDNDYPAQAKYRIASTGSYYYIDGEYLPTLRPDEYDPDIKWEETTTYNIGLDFGFFNGRITGSFDVYKRVTDDLLNTVTIPTGSNFSNTLLTNVGSLENKGLEFALNVIPISQKDFSLEVGFNLAYNENKITRLLLNDDPDYIGVLYGDAMTGQKQVTRVGHPAYSFFVNKQVYDSEGRPIEGLYVDLSGNSGVVNGDNDDKYIYHDPVADVLMGLSFKLNYKNFDMSASSRISLGNYVYNQVAAGSSYDQMYQIGYFKNFPKHLDATQFVKRQFTSDYFVRNASFFKLDYVSFGYTPETKGKFKMRFSFTVQNVFSITDYEGIDPEVPGGIDNNFYPRPRTFMLGIGVTY